jgi:hypothetical protein
VGNERFFGFARDDGRGEGFSMPGSRYTVETRNARCSAPGVRSVSIAAEDYQLGRDRRPGVGEEFYGAIADDPKDIDATRGGGKREVFLARRPANVAQGG